LGTANESEMADRVRAALLNLSPYQKAKIS
jgi:hypothetical protein